MSENGIKPLCEVEKQKSEEKTVRLTKEAYLTLKTLSDDSGVPMSKIVSEWLSECKKVYESLGDGKLLLMSQKYEKDNVVVTYMAKIMSGKKYFVEGEKQ
jgi:hypothetical protein